MNDPAKFTVTSDVPVDRDAPEMVAVAFAFASDPLGAHEESVSIRTIKLSTGADALLRPISIEEALTPFPIIRIDTLVFAATSPIFCHADGTVVT